MKRKFSDEQLIDALTAARGLRAEAARRLGTSPQTIFAAIDRLKAKGVEVPESTYDGTLGTSTLFGPDGEVKLQWVKQSHDGRSPEQWAEAVREAFAGTDPVKPISAPRTGLKDLLTVYPVGDHHVGLYAWGAEAGEDYDIKTAERLLV